MPRLASLLSFSLLALVQFPGGLAGPACARKYYQAADCIQRCQSRWGYSGAVMGTNPWGSVMKNNAQSSDSLDQIIASACGMPAAAASSSSHAPFPAVTVAGAVGNNPNSVYATNAATTEAVQESSTSIVSSPLASVSPLSALISFTKPISSTTKLLPTTPTTTLTTTPTTSTTEVESHPPPSPTTSPKPKPTTTKAPSKPTTTTQTAPKTTAASSGGDNGSNSNGDSGNSSSGSSSGGPTSASDIAAYLKGHNDVRAQHGAAPLSYDQSLAAKAQTWANNCVFQHSHGSLGPFGENLAAGTGDAYGIPEAIKSWTDEVSQYNPSDPVASHFTQVVWKDTQRVGCAVQLCDGIFDPSFGKAKFYVCEYDPPGNFNNDFAANVQV